MPLRLHFHLFRAAALYELFLRSRETDQALRAQALAEVRALQGDRFRISTRRAGVLAALRQLLSERPRGCAAAGCRVFRAAVAARGRTARPLEHMRPA